MAEYITVADFKAARTGVQLTDVTDAALLSYIRRASAAIEQFCDRVFAYQAGVVERLSTAGWGRAVIASSGLVFLYPTQRFPIVGVTSITWRLRSPRGPSATVVPSQPLDSGDYEIDRDRWGDGYRILVWRNLAPLRDPGVSVEFVVTYDGGYQEPYPDWLQEAALEWTLHLLKARGASAVAMTGSGEVVDASSLGNHLQKAQDILEPRRRRF